MIWLELRTNNTRFKDGWNLSESVWAPVTKANGAKWPFWYLVNSVRKGDLIFHLKQNNNKKQFIGYSVANTDGYSTYDKPTDNIHEWDFSKAFYKVDLIDFQPLFPLIELSDYFSKNDLYLRDYYKGKGNKRLFYTIQNGILQCLFGGYFSEFNDELPKLLIDIYAGKSESVVSENAKTGVAIKEMAQRIGHQIFSENVKANFNYKCCFPNCEVDKKGFLISGHIARWADNEALRGHTENGLCFCLMHDKAFEKGLFTLDAKYRIVIIDENYKYVPWLKELLHHGHSKVIKDRNINPSLNALKLHWKRIGYS